MEQQKTVAAIERRISDCETARQLCTSEYERERMRLAISYLKGELMLARERERGLVEQKKAKHWDCEAGRPCWKCDEEAKAGGAPWWSPAGTLNANR